MKDFKENNIIVDVRNDFSELNHWLANHSYSNYFIVVDENTQTHCLPKLFPILKNSLTYVIPAGEEHKNLKTADSFWSWSLEQHMDKSALVIAIGGGVVCDLIGFCTSVFKRGVDIIYLPTSLMAMADAAIGGKTAINLNGSKNQIGSYSFPKLVYIYPWFLQTLDDRNMRNGFVEIVKHSLLSDEANWNRIRNSTWPLEEKELLSFLIQSINFKKSIVEQDIYENGWRKILNFGHSIGHAIESYYLSKGIELLHGEAIAYGIICEAKISKEIFGWEADDLNNIVQFLSDFCVKDKFDEMSVDQIIDWMSSDKKIMHGKQNFSLLQKIGSPVINVPVEQKLIHQVLTESFV